MTAAEILKEFESLINTIPSYGFRVKYMRMLKELETITTQKEDDSGKAAPTTGHKSRRKGD